jgi:hypothetical protein
VVGSHLWVFWGLLLLVFSFLVVLVYTSCVRRGALRFFIYINASYLSKKKMLANLYYFLYLNLFNVVFKKNKNLLFGVVFKK